MPKGTTNAGKIASRLRKRLFGKDAYRWIPYAKNKIALMYRLRQQRVRRWRPAKDVDIRTWIRGGQNYIEIRAGVETAIPEWVITPRTGPRFESVHAVVVGLGFTYPFFDEDGAPILEDGLNPGTLEIFKCLLELRGPFGSTQWRDDICTSTAAADNPLYAGNWPNFRDQVKFYPKYCLRMDEYKRLDELYNNRALYRKSKGGIIQRRPKDLEKGQILWGNMTWFSTDAERCISWLGPQNNLALGFNSGFGNPPNLNNSNRLFGQRVFRNGKLYGLAPKNSPEWTTTVLINSSPLHPDWDLQGDVPEREQDAICGAAEWNAPTEEGGGKFLVVCNENTYNAGYISGRHMPYAQEDTPSSGATHVWWIKPSPELDSDEAEDRSVTTDANIDTAIANYNAAIGTPGLDAAREALFGELRRWYKIGEDDLRTAAGHYGLPSEGSPVRFNQSCTECATIYPANVGTIWDPPGDSGGSYDPIYGLTQTPYLHLVTLNLAMTEVILNDGVTIYRPDHSIVVSSTRQPANYDVPLTAPPGPTFSSDYGTAFIQYDYVNDVPKWIKLTASSSTGPRILNMNDQVIFDGIGTALNWTTTTWSEAQSGIFHLPFWLDCRFNAMAYSVVTKDIVPNPDTYVAVDYVRWWPDDIPENEIINMVRPAYSINPPLFTPSISLPGSFASSSQHESFGYATNGKGDWLFNYIPQFQEPLGGFPTVTTGVPELIPLDATGIPAPVVDFRVEGLQKQLSTICDITAGEGEVVAYWPLGFIGG